MPTQQTPQQLASAIKPNPTDLTLPTNSGLFRAIGDSGDNIYYTDPTTGALARGDLRTLDPQSGKPYGGQNSNGVSTLQSRYGVDFNSLPSVNIADLTKQQLASGKLKLGSNGMPETSAFNWDTLHQLPSLTTGTTTINSQANPLNPNAPAPGAGTGTAPVTDIKNPDGTTTAVPQGTAPQTAQPTAQPISNYTGPSVVDYLASVGQPSDFASRKILAQNLGIQNYSGTAAQNTQMLNTLRSSQPQGGGSTSTLPSQQPQNQPQTPGSKPVSTPTDFISEYQKIIKSLGLTDIKGKFDEVNKQYTDLNSQLQDKILTINDNPWLSEGIRQKQIEHLTNSYATRLDTLTHEQTIYDSLYQQGIAEAKFMATGEQSAQQQAFDNALKLQEASAKLVETNPANFKEVQGGLYDVKKNKWIIPPQAKTKSGTNNVTTDNERALFSQFNSEPIVKQFNVLSEGYQFVKSLSNTTNNPADDQGLIYAFAKAMDPNSVVREGEYATVQKYAQSLISSYGSSVNQAIAGTGFLTEDARKNIKKTIDSKYQASLQNYQNLSEQYKTLAQRQGLNPKNVVVDYSKGYQGQTYTPGDVITNNHVMYLVGSDGETITPIGSAL